MDMLGPPYLGAGQVPAAPCVETTLPCLVLEQSPLTPSAALQGPRPAPTPGLTPSPCSKNA